jgi:hypothetical protein
MGASHVDYFNDVATTRDRFKVADETWCINSASTIVHAERAFRMDDLIRYKPESTKWINDFPGIVYTSVAYPDEFPNSVEYPLDGVVNCVNSFYFNTGPAYAVALAIYLEVKTLKLYGIDYNYVDNKTREVGRPCVEFYLGMAAERGMHIEIAKKCTLLGANPEEKRRVLYGYMDCLQIEKDPKTGKFVIKQLEGERQEVLDAAKGKIW